MWGLCWKRAAEAAFSKIVAGVRLTGSRAATVSLYGRMNGFAFACVFL